MDSKLGYLDVFGENGFENGIQSFDIQESDLYIVTSGLIVAADLKQGGPMTLGRSIL